MKTKRLLSLLLAVVMVISLVTVTAITTTAANTMDTADTSATYNYQANSMYQLEMYLKIAGNCKIKLTGDCLCSHELGSEGHTTTQVNGIKTIDLNGYDIICKDESNATKVKHNHTFITGDCIASNLGKGTGVMMNVNSGATLTIEDSSNGEGRIHYDGRTIGYTAGPYASDMHYLGYAKRDVFEVEGTLILNDGVIEAGREEKHYFSDSRTESGGVFNANAYEQIKGTAVKVLNGGKFVVNGGTVSGLGMATTSYEEINAIEINSEGEVFVNDGKISALGGANIFGGKGVDGGLHIAAGIFAIDKRDKIRINDVQGGYFTSPVSAYLYYPRVTNGKYGVMGIPDSAWKNQLGHKRVEVHELESDKYYTYTGWKDSDFAIDFSGNNYKEIAICGRSTYNTDAVFLQATYGSTALGNKSVLVYYPDTADKFRVTYDYASDPYFKYGNTTLKYDWKIWHTVKDDTPDFQMTNTSATINPIKPISTVDFSGKIIYVQCTVSDVSNYNSDEVFYINTTESTYIEPTTSVLGVLEFTNQTPPMDRYSTSANIYGTVTGDTFSFSFNNVPLTSKYINEGYVITRGYEIYKSGMTSELLDKKTGIAGTNDVTASFVPTTSGLYTIYEYLYLDKNGTRVQVANNVIYLSVKDGYQIFEAHATVDAPAHGRLPDFDAVTDTEHVKVVDVDWSKKADDGEYYLMDDNETFIAGEYYECIVVFEATDGYTFFDTPTGTVNSKDRILYNHDEQRAAFGVQFECPLGVIFTDDSAAVGGGKLEVDVERMAELDDEFMEAYLNDGIKYKWYYDGLLQVVTRTPTYEIKPGMVGHYIGVKVVYGDKSVSSDEYEIKEATTTGKLGDVDGDGDITIMDATAVQLHIASLEILTADAQKRADTDCDGNISIIDATNIQLFVAKLITEF